MLHCFRGEKLSVDLLQETEHLNVHNENLLVFYAVHVP